MEKLSDRILFVDTDAITTYFYCKFLLGEESEELSVCEKYTDAISTTSEWDLVLFLEPDGVNFVQDGTRNELIAEKLGLTTKW